MDELLHDKIQRIANERTRMEREEEAVRAEAQEELDKIIMEIEKLEEKRETLESFLNINDPDQRMQHGAIRNLCFDILARHRAGLTSSQIKDIIQKENHGIKLGSVPASLSYQTAQGKLRRDNLGRYFLADGA